MSQFVSRNPPMLSSVVIWSGMLVPCNPYGRGSVLLDFARLIHKIPTGFLGPAARYCSDGSTGVDGVGSGLGLAKEEATFWVCAFRSFWSVASRGRGITSRIVQELRPCRPGRAGDMGRTAISAPLRQIFNCDRPITAAVTGFLGSACG